MTSLPRRVTDIAPKMTITIPHPPCRILLLISAKDDPFIGFTATPNDVSESVTILDTEHGGHIGYLRYRSDNGHSKSKSSVTDDKESKTSKFDINWIPETVSAYFNWIGVASISEPSQDVVSDNK